MISNKADLFILENPVIIVYWERKIFMEMINLTKIIFVCFGNICRSPMAEFVMKHLVAQRGIEKNFLIESAGCHPSIGTPMAEGTARELRKNHVPFTRRTSKLLLESDYKRFDYLILV